MNTNHFFKDLFEDTLGLDVLGLEYMYPGLVKMIHTNTLKVFSGYASCLYTITLDVDDPTNKVSERTQYPLNQIDYMLTDPILDLLNLPILDIMKATPEMNENLSSLYTSQSTDIFDFLIGSERTTTQSLIASALPFKKRFDKVGDNLISLTNYSKTGKVVVIVRTKFPTLESVPESYAEEFKVLAAYDIKIKLWSQLKYVEDIVTPNGNLNLKINDWDSAYRDRQEYLKELRQRAFPDITGQYYFTTF